MKLLCAFLTMTLLLPVVVLADSGKYELISRFKPFQKEPIDRVLLAEAVENSIQLYSQTSDGQIRRAGVIKFSDDLQLAKSDLEDILSSSDLRMKSSNNMTGYISMLMAGIHESPKSVSFEQGYWRDCTDKEYEERRKRDGLFGPIVDLVKGKRHLKHCSVPDIKVVEVTELGSGYMFEGDSGVFDSYVRISLVESENEGHYRVEYHVGHPSLMTAHRVEKALFGFN
jgi:hypothetical protein